MSDHYPNTFHPAPDAYRPIQIREIADLEHLRLSLNKRASAFNAIACPPFEDPALMKPGPCSPLLKYMMCRVQCLYHDYPIPLTTEEVIRYEQVWLDAYFEGDNPLIDATLLAMKAERTALEDAEIWRLCYRAASLLAGGVEFSRKGLREKVNAQRLGSSKGGKPGEVKGPLRWAWLYLKENLETVAYDSDGRRLSRYALSEKLHSEMLHTVWRQQHSGARFAPENCLPSAKTLRESPLWLKSMGLEALPETLNADGFPA
ncbi:hypothetical protein GLV89_14570 [Halomonas alkaliantarctica]|nr:hypothetical protein [Halomonas alkaliantarctica]